LSFKITIGSILHLFKESVEFNIHQILSSFKLPLVTGAAFSKARYKIKSDLFKDISQLVVNYSETNCEQKLWKGYRLLAGDGSTLSLPASKQIVKYFGMHNGTKSCLAQVFMLYDVLSDIIIDTKLSTEKISEKTQFLDILKSLKKQNEIILLDRGFGYFNICQLLTQQGRQFCVRMSTSSTASSFARQMMLVDKDDIVVDWHPSESSRNVCKKQQLSVNPLKIRVTKIRLQSGEVELLVSNLIDQNKITASNIKELYNYRWNVEEGFKKLKSKLKIEYFGCKKPEGIYQEFYAHIFFMNLIAITGQIAQNTIEHKTKKCHLTYKYNWQNAYRCIRKNLLQFLYLKNIKILLDKLLDQISKSISAIRKDRSFERKKRGTKCKPRYSQMYK
jgi:hypothetical protein